MRGGYGPVRGGPQAYIRRSPSCRRRQRSSIRSISRALLVSAALGSPGPADLVSLALARAGRTRAACRLQVQVTGHYPRRKQPGTYQHTYEALHQLALIVHTRIAEAHETPELRILPIKRLLDLL